MYSVVDMTRVNWGFDRENGSTYGCYGKTKIKERDGVYYYKLSNFNSEQGFIGEESIYEVISSRFLRLLGFDCVKYSLVKVRVNIFGRTYITFACKSRNFKTQGTWINFDTFREMFIQVPMEELIGRFHMGNSIREIIAADFMIIGRDRHGANIQVCNVGNNYRIGPIFDNGISLLAPIPVNTPGSLELVQAFDTGGNYPVNNYIGTRSLYANLGYLEGYPVHANKLHSEDKRRIFYNLSETLPKEYINKCWEILTFRYDYLRKGRYII